MMNLRILNLFLAATVIATYGWSAEPVYIGTRSCSQFACHGRSSSPKQESWKSAYSVWATHDPHVRALDALFSPRAEQMFELLSQPDDMTGKPLRSSSGIGGEEYRSFLERRCIACHGTPTSDEEATASPKLHKHARLDGIGCESCHGAARVWVSEHTTSRWSEKEKKNSDRWGMRDMEPLTNRAAVCIACHVGPQTGKPNQQFAVDHDLIAAGHPRLAFEFNAYFSNLPPHWDASEDIRRHEQQNGPRSFHFDTWRAGQWQSVVQRTGNLADDLSSIAVGNSFAGIDLATFNCSECHHGLTAETQRARNPTFAARTPLRFADEPFDGIQMLLRSSKEPMLNTLSQEVHDLPNIAQRTGRDTNQLAQRCTELARRLREVPGHAKLERFSVADRAQILLQLAESLDDPSTASWDRSVQFFLAIQAYVDDFDATNLQNEQLHKNAAALFKHLDDSPNTLDVADAEYVQLIQAVRRELKQLMP